MKSLVLLLLFSGIICITIGYARLNRECPSPQVVYRYVPQSVYAEQMSLQEMNNPNSNIGKMFNDPIITPL